MTDPWRRKVTLGDGQVTLYEGDCLEILPHLERVDAVVTDPPYSSGGQFRGDRAQDVHTKYVNTESVAGQLHARFSGDTRDQLGYWYWVSMWLCAARQKLAPGGIAALFTDWRQLPITSMALQAGGLVWRGVVPWHKPAARPTQGRWANSCEYVVWGTNGPRELVGRGFPGFYAESPPSGLTRSHMTEKPLGVLRDMLEVVADSGAILDPFMGSGTTGVAAVQLGRRFVGIEIEPRYFDIAVERITHALAQPRLFEDEPTPEQEALL